MTPDEEAAALCGIAYSALLLLPEESHARRIMRDGMAVLAHEIARLRGQTPESIQNEFEKRAAS